MTGKAHMHFSGGKPLKQVEKATYLGSEINSDAGRWTESNNRMKIALRTCNELQTLWYETDCPHRWKLQVYNAAVIAQITCSMNTVHLTPAMLQRMDAFQMKGLRYILKLIMNITREYPAEKFTTKLTSF